MSMTNEELQRLMLDVLDGTATKEEQIFIAAALEEDPALRQQFEDARAAGHAMEGTDLVASPPGLMDRIRESLGFERRRTMQDAGRRLDWRRLIADRPFFSLASVFATGGAAGILIFALLTGPGPGGVAPAPPIHGEMGPIEGPHVERSMSRIDLGDLTVALRGSGQDLAVRLETKDSKQPIAPVEIDFERALVVPLSATWNAGMEGQVEIGAGRIVITPRGAVTCELLMRVKDGRAGEMRIASADGGQRTLALTRAR